MSDLIDKNKAMLVLYDVCKEHKHREPLHTVLGDAEARISHLETCTEDELYEEGVQDERARWRKLCDPAFSEEEMKKTKANVKDLMGETPEELAESDRAEIQQAVSELDSYEIAVMQNAAELCCDSLKEWVTTALTSEAHDIVNSQNDQEYIERENYVPPLESETVITPNTELEDRVWALETELKAVKLRENAKSDILRKLVDRFFLDYGNKYFKSLIDACTPKVIDIS